MSAGLLILTCSICCNSKKSTPPRTPPNECCMHLCVIKILHQMCWLILAGCRVRSWQEWSRCRSSKSCGDHTSQVSDNQNILSYFSSSIKQIWGHFSLLWGHSYPCLVTSNRISKSGSPPLLAFSLVCDGSLQIHLWCYTCQPLGVHQGSRSPYPLTFLFYVCETKY